MRTHETMYQDVALKSSSFSTTSLFSPENFQLDAYMEYIILLLTESKLFVKEI